MSLLSSTQRATNDAKNGGGSSDARGTSTGMGGNNMSSPDNSHNMAHNSRNMARSTLEHQSQN